MRRLVHIFGAHMVVTGEEEEAEGKTRHAAHQGTYSFETPTAPLRSRARAVLDGLVLAPLTVATFFFFILSLLPLLALPKHLAEYETAQCIPEWSMREPTGGFLAAVIVTMALSVLTVLAALRYLSALRLCGAYYVYWSRKNKFLLLPLALSVIALAAALLTRRDGAPLSPSQEQMAVALILNNAASLLAFPLVIVAFDVVFVFAPSPHAATRWMVRILTLLLGATLLCSFLIFKLSPLRCNASAVARGGAASDLLQSFAGVMQVLWITKAVKLFWTKVRRPDEPAIVFINHHAFHIDPIPEMSQPLLPPRSSTSDIDEEEPEA